ncbi:hypothetical protein M406DRAFT_273066 [Cryphonectria parasitica EP155]|uniref:Thioesterase domain-containing protein n=1 Tax=Cryphonectria parasitica (strain ATCC 38755 / EP155) TaxID=660469 RepID=A0A9P4Y8B6_CRYP1|nr:uncharacterized protein M406DRAFT_273066 [Cryphonectria parasitica EP155]KAF3768628.1 hypothetical protein M406DRAFT_273066 [Cryphonectria parasitica EP155]
MASPIPPQSPPPKPPRRARRRWVSAAIFLLIGGLSGTILRAVISPPPPLIAGSPADLALKADIQARALTLPLVKKLMADPAWSHHEAYQTVPVSDDTPRITTGPLGSSTGIGAYQHIFVHDDDAPQHPVLNILYLGTSTTSWPGVVHGGLLATVLDEHAARGALADPALRSASVGVLTANLELHYRRPTLAGEFYVARARAIPDTELEPKERGKRQRKIWVDVSLETMDGKECVGGRALFIVPRGGKALPSGAVTLPPSNR